MLRCHLLAFMFYAVILVCIFNHNCLLGHAWKFKEETDRQALLAVKDAITFDANKLFKSWNTSLHHCQWPGISCNRQRVTGLDLSSQGLVGHLSSHIGNLSFLRNIFLQNNSFCGEIPPEFGMLFRLRLLDLSSNSFSGQVPKNLTSCMNLEVINLVDNNLTGKVPVELSTIPNLSALSLGKNNFRGQIPTSLGNSSSLTWLYLREAKLEGSIPEDIGRLTSLQYLIISENNLTGTIPSGIYNLSSLVILAAAVNRLEGNLPADIGYTLPNIEWLALGGNRFTGSIPTSLLNASKLQNITLSFNRFSGPVPVELGRLVNLSWLGLSNNMLGTVDGNGLGFISFLTNCTKLKRLTFGGNFLKGPLPKSIANLSTQIRYLSLGKNQIYGTIPSRIGNLVNLNLLDVQDMMLHGNIPNEIGNLQKLLELYAGDNALTGQIPSSIGNLTALYVLQLGNNKLSGIITPGLVNSQKLLVLDLSQNDLNGYVPASLFHLSSVVFINLSYNSFISNLPQDVGRLKQLESLDVSMNKLSGVIPNTLSSCLSLMSLRMGYNYFEGLIPQELSALRGLTELDLSQNNLSGTIPEYLGGLSFLQMLNLSFNDLHGEVPKTGNFKNASLFSITGNKKLCGGILELKLPSCTIYSNQKGLSLALKVTIPLLLLAVCLSLSAGFIILNCRKNRSNRMTSPALLDNQIIRISYRQLLRATDGFSNANLIGSGSYGSVYEGFLPQTQSSIAVKVFDFHQKKALESFISECRALSNIRHRNLLRILSVCSSVDSLGNDFRAAVYEFMPGGSLESWLHPPEVLDNENQSRSLNLKQRLDIAIDIACALEYLHCHRQPPVVHSDIKPSNVLLDDDMVAHVGDFGLAKVLAKFPDDYLDSKSSSDIVQGTIGYVAPEYGAGKERSIQGDVYSFGILMLEIFTAKRPTDDMFQDGLNLHRFTRTALPERIKDVVDLKLLNNEDTDGRTQKCLLSILRIGILCSVEMPEERMKIRDAVRGLTVIKEAYEGKRHLQCRETII